MNILTVLNKVAADPSGNAKKAMLTAEKNNVLLQRVFKAAYDPYINYWIKKIPAYTRNAVVKHTLDEAINELQFLANRTYTGHAGVQFLTDILESVLEDDATVIERIIGRDLRSGCSDSTANKIWPGLIPTFEVMLAHKDASGIKFPAICQIKSDGMRVHAYFDGKALKLFTRSGKEVTTHGTLDATAVQLMKVGETFDGELVCYRNGVALDRKTSNGIGNKGVKGTIGKEEAELFRLVTWDIVDFTETIAYKVRFTELESRFSMMPAAENKFKLIPSKIVASMEEADEMFAAALANKEEGVILKNINAVWQPKRTKDLGKLKAEEEADLVVVGWNEGTGKYAGLMGSLVCETADGKLNVNVSGWSDEERKTLTAKNTKGRIITVMYNAIIDSRGRDTKSLFLPRVVEFREDKKVANTLSELK